MTFGLHDVYIVWPNAFYIYV